MGWDIRRGQSFPTLYRVAFEMEGDFSTRDIKEAIWELQGKEFISPASFATGLNNLTEGGHLKRVRQGSRGRGNASVYRVTDMGREWWEMHKDEGWGHGEEWEPEGGWEDKPWLSLDSKLWRAVDSGKQVVVKMPCSRSVWKDLVAMCKAGQVELVVRKKRNG